MNTTLMTVKWLCLAYSTTDRPATCPIITVTREPQIKAQTSNISQSSKGFPARSCCYSTRTKYAASNCSMEEFGLVRIKYKLGTRGLSYIHMAKDLALVCVSHAPYVFIDSTFMHTGHIMQISQILFLFFMHICVNVCLCVSQVEPSG